MKMRWLKLYKVIITNLVLCNAVIGMELQIKQPTQSSSRWSRAAFLRLLCCKGEDQKDTERKLLIPRPLSAQNVGNPIVDLSLLSDESVFGDSKYSVSYKATRLPLEIQNLIAQYVVADNPLIAKILQKNTLYTKRELTQEELGEYRSSLKQSNLWNLKRINGDQISLSGCLNGKNINKTITNLPFTFREDHYYIYFNKTINNTKSIFSCISVGCTSSCGSRFSYILKYDSELDITVLYKLAGDAVDIRIANEMLFVAESYKVGFYDIDTLQPVKNCILCPDRVISIALRDPYILVGYSDKISLHRVSDAALIKSFDLELSMINVLFRDYLYVDYIDDKTFFSAEPEIVKVWDIESGKCLTKYKLGRGEMVIGSFDTAIVIQEKDKIKLWNYTDYKTFIDFFSTKLSVVQAKFFYDYSRQLFKFNLTRTQRAIVNGLLKNAKASLNAEHYEGVKKVFREMF